MIEVSKLGNTSTIRIAGRFDFRSVRQFQLALEQPAFSWVVDMSGVDFVDSAALGLLLMLRERAGNDNARVVLRGLRAQPRDVLLMAKFDRLFGLES